LMIEDCDAAPDIGQGFSLALETELHESGRRIEGDECVNIGLNAAAGERKEGKKEESREHKS
jgi:hypothetical protein